VLLALAGAAPARAAELPLGSRSLDETRERAQVAPGLRWTRIEREGGPWRLNVLEIDRELIDGRVAGALSNRRVAGLEQPSRTARRLRAVAGVNGTFFALDGDPIGALALGGSIVSEPLDGRSALIVPSASAARVRVAPLGFEGSVRSRDAERLVDGVDRPRGRIPACGGRGGDRPTEDPNPLFTCTDPSELVVYTRRWGAARPSGGVEALLRAGEPAIVERVGAPAGGPIPRSGLVLSGSGDAARFLRRRLEAGDPVSVDLRLLAGEDELKVERQELVTSAGPRLLTGSRVTVRARPEGFAPDPSFFGSFVASRNPRTLAGVRADGTLLLVTVDGRQPGWSAGVTLVEAARVMRSLGARDAVNLDGGGSTVMVIRGEVVNRPSDPGGERAVSNGVFVLP
jgi:hypothetical protein